MKKAKTTKINKGLGMPLAVLGVNDSVCMLSRNDKKTTSSLCLSWSRDGINFLADDKRITIEAGKKKENIKNCDRFSLSSTPNGFVLIYVRLGNAKRKVKDKLIVARSKDLYKWTVKSEIPANGFHRASVVYNKPLDMFELYTDGLFIRGQSSRTLSVWRNKSSLLFTSRSHHFDSDKISIIGSIVSPQGILLLYDAKIIHGRQTLLQAGAVLFDINNPKHILWRSDSPIWQGIVETDSHKKKTGGKKIELHPIGFVTLFDKFLIYWSTSKGNLIVAKIPALFKELEYSKDHPRILKRFHGNPIIQSRGEHTWEGEGTFNPTVVQDDEGVIHLLYRALGNDGISRVGYARSKDGIHFTNRLPYPIFEPSRGYGLPDPKKATGPIGYHPAMYTSGGGWGGAEDPRAVKIDDNMYMIYVAFEGWGSVRIALTSISVDDFKHGRWNWKKPKLISPPGKVSKNWLLFPEKIKGKYAILHSIAPRIMIEYIDDIDSFDEYIDSPRPEGVQPGRADKWDGMLRGAGPPPIKTDIGWLLLYHALDKKDPSRYKLGAMILDKNDPTKVLYRSAHPILSPDMHYENNGKPGIVYASGATIRGNDLFVYYGGADKVSCVATTNLKDFLHYLVTGSTKSYILAEVSTNI